MSQVLKPYLGKFLVIYFNDILIFSRNRDEHPENPTFEILCTECLFLNAKKYSFLETQLRFLGFIVLKQGLMVDPAKIDAIFQRLEPQSITEVRSFLSLAAFYRCFIKGFITLATPMTSCISKHDFDWTLGARRAFLALKEIMASAPVLCLPDFLKVFEVACDALGTGIDGMLSQEGHLIAFFSEKVNDLRQRYSTYDKEFYAIIQSLC